MSRNVTSRADWSTILVEDEESDQPIGPVVDQQPSGEQPKQEESPAESQDVTPDEERADAEAPELQGEGEGNDLEADTEDLVILMTRGERGDNPEVMGQPYANPQPIEMLEAGEGKPPV